MFRLQANCITGFSISNWLTLGFSFAPGSVAWRFPLAFQIFFTFLIYVLCPFLPDSPRLLIRKGKYEEALEVIAALQGDGATPDCPSVKSQFNIIKDILDREHMTSYTWTQLLTGRGTFLSSRNLQMQRVSEYTDTVNRTFRRSPSYDTRCLDASHEPNIRYQHHQLLHVIRLHQRSEHRRTTFPHSCRCRKRRLSHLRMPCLLHH